MATAGGDHVTLWQHLWPGFDAVWPNLLASLIWTCPAGLAHLHIRRKLRQLNEKHDALHARIDGRGR